MSFVLDNSVALAWCFEDEHTPSCMRLLERVTETGAVAPMLWPLEAINGLIMAQRRGRIDAAKRRQLAGFLRVLPVELDEEMCLHAWESIMHLADRFGLSAYDAVYLELASRRALPLATLDKDLRKAAKKSGLSVLG